MSALDIVVTKLKATAGVTALVPKASIFPGSLPQGTAAPAVCAYRVGGTDQQMLSGAGRMYRTRVRVEAYATTASACDAIGTAIMSALEDVVKQTIAGHAGTDIRFGDVDLDGWADDRSLASRTLDFYVDWKPAA